MSCDEEEETARYEVTVRTSRLFADAGTKSKVKVRIYGSRNRTTQWVALEDFSPEPGDIGTYKLLAGKDKEENVPDVGKPLMIEIKLFDYKRNDSWYCNKLTVFYKGKFYQFPLYDWIEDESVSVVSGKAQLPQNVNRPEIAAQRRAEVQRNLQEFEWMARPSINSISYGLPRHLPAKTPEQLPEIFKWIDVKEDDFTETQRYALTALYQKLAKLANFEIKTFDDYKQIFAGLSDEDPPFIDVWQTDEEMGRQVLNGINPLIVKRCEEIPPYCDITNETCVLPKNTTLKQEMEKGRIYISDFKPIIEGVSKNPNSSTGGLLHCSEAVALFHSSEKGTFLPIAIQLTPDDSESIFNPNDAHYDWLLAKMYFQTTNASVQEWMHHYVFAHATTETFGIATFRNFARNHPLYKLLRPHLRTTPRVNIGARQSLLPAGSPANFALALSAGGSAQKCFKDFDISMLHIPEVLEKNGTDDSELLKPYYYRDYALDLWEVIEDYVEDVINEYYDTDGDVSGDFELQAWANDLATEGFGWFDGNPRGMPESIPTTSELIRICTIIIFTSTVQHTALNWGQFETYKFIPSNPFSMRLPVPKKGEGSMERIIASLPDVKIATIQAALTYSLSKYSANAIYLGEIRDQLFVERKLSRYQARFARQLRKLSRQFNRKNRRVSIPYVYLMPSRITASIDL